MGKPKYSYLDEKRWALYTTVTSAQEVAQLAGVSTSTVSRWRKKHGHSTKLHGRQRDTMKPFLEQSLPDLERDEWSRSLVCWGPEGNPTADLAPGTLS